ncbi:MAG: hypothetical protein RI556_12295 [Hydrogenovibrio sp.]|uniref:hypothetical protein n=1 Tax=Hydrogenovibrio sp. TaxID=2065821 RepID=UPI0028708483|nr:hypothetical protein [Hydrogenovibrio sp.]MDR9499949.1 hypothetical protein [Hydrogenovibrio sp.]
MATVCPGCGSQWVVAKHLGKTVGATAGLIGGGITGFSSAVNGARVGGTVGALAGPVGVGVGSLGGAILCGLAGAASGGVAGVQIGQKVDRQVLKNYACKHCGHRFCEADLVDEVGTDKAA